MSKPFVYAFTTSPAGDAAEIKGILGGKGASLAAMTQAGLRVPPGFTISTECCRYYLEHNQSWPDALEIQVREHLTALEKDTGRTFGQGSQPLLVSVRSGAAVSMPGMMDTILNCGIHIGLADQLGESPQFWRVFCDFVRTFGSTVRDVELSAPSDFDGVYDRTVCEHFLSAFESATGAPLPSDPWTLLVECIEAVFRSWSSERAIAYRGRNNIEDLLGTAVNVQAMWPSHISGILFTRDPQKPAAEEMIIESALGLGESIVSGDVTPDRFVVDRNDYRNVKTVMGTKGNWLPALGDNETFEGDGPSLTSDQIVELSELAMRVETHFGKPMDLEWGLAEGRFALLQSRPIRGLEVAADIETGRLEEIDRLKKLADGKQRLWITHNLGETLTAPMPLTWGPITRFMSGDGGFGQMYKDFGYRPSKQVCEEGFLELICGRIYSDPDRQAQLFWDGLPMKYDRNELLEDRSNLDRAPTQFDPEAADGTFFLRLPGLVRAMFRGNRTMKRARAEAKTRFENDILPPYLEYVRDRRNHDLEKMSTPELWAEWKDRSHRVLHEFANESLKPGFFGGMAISGLIATLTQLMGKQQGTRLASELTGGLDGDITFEQDVLLYDIAQGNATMEQFLERFGHRTLGEMELGEKRWREDSTYLEQVVERLKAHSARSPIEQHHANANRRRQAEAELPETLAQWGGASMLEKIQEEIRDAQELLPYRESGKYYLMMGYELLRLVALELGRRWKLGHDVFFLRENELEQFEAHEDRFETEIADRKVRWQSAQRLPMADLIDTENLDQLGVPEEFEATDSLEGEPVASGVSIGTARIVFDPRKTGDIGTGYVLVCPSTDPGWTPLFLEAAGLVVERGGILSHGAIVARDFGIPAVVCPDATSRIPEGATVRIDGDRGQIAILDQRSDAAVESEVIEEATS